MNIVLQLSHKKTAHQNLPVPHNRYNNRLKQNRVKKHTQTAKQIEARKQTAQTAKAARKLKLTTNLNKSLAIVLIMIITIPKY